MFGKGNLLKNGARAEAAVVSSDMTGSKNSHGARKWKLDLRVQFADGTTEDVSVKAWAVDIAAGYGPGDIVPVRFDQEDRTKVEVDVPQMKAERAERKAEGAAGLARLAEEKLAREVGRPER